MNTNSVSSQALSTSLRLSVARMQTELGRAQKEVASGRQADVGLSLGAQTGHVVSLRHEHSRLQATIDSNSLATGRLGATQQGLQSIRSAAEAFLHSLVDARSGGVSAQSIRSQAASTLQAFTDTVNANVNGEYIFGGLNTDVKPLAAYAGLPPSAGKAAVDAAFAMAFEVPQSDPAVAAITPAAMKSFLDGAFGDLFEGSDWTTAWSSASDKPIRSRISTSELVSTSVSANSPAFQKLAKAYAMVSDLGLDRMSDATFRTTIDAATTAVGGALQDLTDAQAEIGIAQNRVAEANQRMTIQMNVLTTQVDGLEGADPYEASTRVSALMTQIQTAYALTAQLQQLSLLKYL
jgi:flagellar hook-associated protein 3 FlgL